MSEKAAEDFKTYRIYAAGFLVLYNGILYRFIVEHSAGPWNPAQVEPVDQGSEQIITRLIAAADNAIKETAYADTVVFAPSMIERTRYKYVLTNAQDPRE